jgi:hypothetical protein
MQAEIFEWFKLFVQCTKPTKDRSSVLLLLGGYSSHTKHIAAIGAADGNGIVMLCFLLHYVLKMQMLDVAFMRPLYNRYSRESKT